MENVDISPTDKLKIRIRKLILSINNSMVDVFKLIDRDSNESISKQELIYFLKNYKFELTSREIDSLWLSCQPIDNKLSLKDFIREFSSKEIKLLITNVIKSISYNSLRHNIDVFYNFNKFNNKCDGIVKYEDFSPSLKLFDLKLTNEEHTNLRNNLVDVDGEIDLYKFIDQFDERIKKNSKVSIDKAVKVRVGNLFKKFRINIKEAFDAFDKDKSKSISLIEFNSMLQQMKLGMSREQIKSAF